jgi:hypothetical protein
MKKIVLAMFLLSACSEVYAPPARMPPKRTVDIKAAVSARLAVYRSSPWYSRELVGIYSSEIARLTDKYNYDPALLIAQIEVESNFCFYARSWYGAVGAMQIMPVWDHLYYRVQGLSRYLNKNGIEKYRYRVPNNLEVGIIIMRYMIRKNRCISLALIEYSHKKQTYRMYSEGKKKPCNNEYYRAVISLYDDIVSDHAIKIHE